MSLIPFFAQDNFFDEPFAGFWPSLSIASRDRRSEDVSRSWVPRLDVSETESEYKILCELPGLTKEHTKIDVDEEHRRLTISGKREEYHKEDNEKYHVAERRFGDFKRTISLPKSVNLDEGVKAKMQDGVLTINIRKIPPKEVRTLNIE